MTQSKIIEIFRKIDDSFVKVDEDFCEEKLGVVFEIDDTILNALGDDEKLKDMHRKYGDALMDYNYSMIAEYFREGFICGAKVALEICGVKWGK